MSEPNYCLFYKHDRVLSGWIKEIRKNKYVILPEQGSEWTGSANQMAYSWKGEEPVGDVTAYLEKRMNGARKLAESLDLVTMHELCEPGDTFNLDDLAAMFLDEDEGWNRAALFLAIRNDGLYFQQKKMQYVSRSEEEMEKLLEARRKKEEQEKKLETEKLWAEQMKRSERPEIPEEDRANWNDFVSRLEKFAVYLDKSQEKKYFTSLLALNMADPLLLEQKLIQLLDLAGCPCSWGELKLRRTGVSREFPPVLQKEAEALLQKDVFEGLFDLETRDERELDVYSVDNEDTRDYDDAFSVSIDGDQMILRVHIADVAGFVPFDSKLFENALERISSVYTLKEIFPMFPASLSEERFSLTEGQDRPVMTFSWVYNSELEVIDSGIYRSVIRVRKNLTYDEADQFIENSEHGFDLLQKLTEVNKQIRIENGALDLNRKEVILDISEPESIRISKVRENTLASEIVQELAIMANHQAGSYCRDNELPALFRVQPPYQVSKNLPEGEKPALKDLQIKPARLTLEPSEHSGLGLDIYLQATSPIRRFADLVCQWIIFNHLSEQDLPFQEESLLSWAQRAETTQKEYLQVERELIRHWKIKYLSQHESDTFAVEKQRQMRSGDFLILFEDLQLLQEVNLALVPEQERFNMKLNRIDTKLHRLSGIPVDLPDQA